MNVFVLCTGRCGSVTFIEAAKHITNYSAGHESRSYHTGQERLNYPENHIEADNRLAWFLGRLHESYGDNAFYVHLTRDRLETAKSYEKRFDYKRMMMKAYRHGILVRTKRNTYASPLDYCLDYVDTVNANIRLFLRDKTKAIDFRLEDAKDDFGYFWRRVGAQGDLEAARAKWDIHYNASK